MGSIDGWKDPEVKRMEDMIHGAIDASFEDRNRAKEGVRAVAPSRAGKLRVALNTRGRRCDANAADSRPSLASSGSNSFGGMNYKGPKVDGAEITFKLYALSGRLELPRGASKDEIVKAMKGKVLGARRSRHLDRVAARTCAQRLHACAPRQIGCHPRVCTSRSLRLPPAPPHVAASLWRRQGNAGCQGVILGARRAAPQRSVRGRATL